MNKINEKHQRNIKSPIPIMVGYYATKKGAQVYFNGAKPHRNSISSDTKHDGVFFNAVMYPVVETWETYSLVYVLKEADIIHGIAEDIEDVKSCLPHIEMFLKKFLKIPKVFSISIIVK